MFLGNKQNCRCGECSSLNLFDIFWRGNKQIIKCQICAHEKVVAEMSGYPGSGICVYKMQSPPDEVVF